MRTIVHATHLDDDDVDRRASGVRSPSLAKSHDWQGARVWARLQRRQQQQHINVARWPGETRARERWQVRVCLCSSLFDCCGGGGDGKPQK